MATYTSSPVPPTATATATRTNTPSNAPSPVPPTATATRTNTSTTTLTNISTTTPTSTPTLTPVSGILFGSVTTSPPTAVNLTSEGVSDWAHWGLNAATDFNDKSSGGVQIGNVTGVGSAAAQRFDLSTWGSIGTPFSWTDGLPTASASTMTGIFAQGVGVGVNPGFKFTVPADTTTRTLKVCVGSLDEQTRLTASLSDGSASAYTNPSISNTSGFFLGFYTLTYRASSAGQRLIVQFNLTQNSSNAYAGIQAATLR